MAFPSRRFTSSSRPRESSSGTRESTTLPEVSGSPLTDALRASSRSREVPGASSPGTRESTTSHEASAVPAPLTDALRASSL
jgi:hypothetical protein